MKFVRSYRELAVYVKARALARDLFELSKRLPGEEKFALTDQLRRSSRSVGAQIAEAWGKRKYERHFVSKLTDADSEQLETQHWIDTAFDCAYVSEDLQGEYIERLEEIGRMLQGMMDKADLFCTANPARLAEDTAQYFTN